MVDPLLTTLPEENKKSGLLKILSPIFVVILIVILVLVKRQNPDFPIGYIILIGAIILILGAIAFFGLEISNKIKSIQSENSKRKELPEPAEMSVLWDIAMRALTNRIYRDHIREYKQTINHSVGKNMKSLVVEFQVYSVYRPTKLCSILVNANYPKRLPTVIFDSDKNVFQLRQAIQSMSFDPEDPANEEVTEVKNELTGVTATTRKKTYAHKGEKAKEERKENLI